MTTVVCGRSDRKGAAPLTPQARGVPLSAPCCSAVCEGEYRSRIFPARQEWSLEWNRTQKSTYDGKHPTAGHASPAPSEDTQERRALWKEVQRLWRKRAANTQDILASMREEWERELPSLQQP